LHVAATNKWGALHAITTRLRLGVIPATALALRRATRLRPHALHVAATSKWGALHVITTRLRLGVIPATTLTLGRATRLRPNALHVAPTSKWGALHVITARLRLGVIPATALALSRANIYRTHGPPFVTCVALTRPKLNIVPVVALVVVHDYAFSVVGILQF
jgi:hypothetical protein